MDKFLFKNLKKLKDVGEVTIKVTNLRCELEILKEEADTLAIVGTRLTQNNIEVYEYCIKRLVDIKKRMAEVIKQKETIEKESVYLLVEEQDDAQLDIILGKFNIDKDK